MFYIIHTYFMKKTYRFLAIPFLIATSLLNILSTNVSAEVEFGPTAQEYRDIGYQAQQEGDLNRALTFYQKVLGMGEESPWIYNNLGVIYEQMGFADRAELYYLKALELDSTYLPPYTNLAFLYEEKGDLPRAISYFRKRIEAASPNDEWVPLLVRELSRLDPTYRSQVITVQMEETGARLFQLAQEELTLDVARADGHYRQAMTYVDQKQFEKAHDEIQKALALTPNNPKLIKSGEQIENQRRIFDIKMRVTKALNLLDAGNLDAARQEFQEILPIFPGQPVQRELF